MATPGSDISPDRVDSPRMKALALSVIVAASLAQAASSRPPMRNVGTMSDLMVKIIYPASDALFYIESRTPKTETSGLRSRARR